MKPTGRFFALIFIASNIALSQPKLSVDKLEVDLGTFYSGVKQKGKIMIKNTGNDTLQILSVQPGCGCTTVKQPKKFLLPNQSDAIEVEFNSTGYRGRVEKHVTIMTNDPTSQNVEVKLIANVADILVLLPIQGISRVWFNNPPLGTTSTQTYSFENISGEQLKIKGVLAATPDVQVVVGKEKLNPNDTLQIQVSIKPEKTGYTATQFTIQTDHKKQPQVNIKVEYYIPIPK
jgi:hypothetical protein